MTGLYGSQREMESGETVTADHEYIEESIKDPGAKVAKGFLQGVMPATFGQLPHDQIDQLIEFIESLK
jgi:cytochrome c oxidase subunit 2